ncbi:zinc finger protein 830 [Anopheles ziemanni]|uniref:zinc finger protein 830 n=1 Tax=Anopheles coustani TaxID=139045 RepID=UPI0026595032|nr:zinc finger protein 830 [Anopheles coustani]XP_058172648.1 zinc finger protein 830 [Anopheles ziemanni]
MSASIHTAKKKYSQQELRRIMSETKAAKQLQQSESAVKRIDSPLAKYNDLGQLTCALCRSIVRSEAVWKVHINSKQHKEHVELAKQLKEQPTRTTLPIRDSTISSHQSDNPSKRPATSVTTEDSIPMKKPKGILKNSQSQSVQNTTLPNDFFDNKLNGQTGNKNASSIRKDLVNIRLPDKHHQQIAEAMEQDPAVMDGGTAAPSEEEKLPEGFFDDPKMDAKARNQEYKDPDDEEWEKFQKEIKEATNVSMAIISEEQEESTAERQIAEIDEQIRNWSRVLSLEKKKEQVQTLKGISSSSRQNGKQDGSLRNASRVETVAQDDEDDDDDEFDEFLDWRAKKSFK